MTKEKSTLEKIKMLLSGVKTKMSKAELVEGIVIEYEGDSIAVGGDVDVILEDGERADAPDGEHETVDGIVFVTEDSVVTEIKEVEVSEEAQEDAEEAVEELEMEDEAESASLSAKVDALEAKLEELMAIMGLTADVYSKQNAELKSIKNLMSKTYSKLHKLSNVPALSTDKQVEVKNQFNKTNAKDSRAKQILSSK